MDKPDWEEINSWMETVDIYIYYKTNILLARCSLVRSFVREFSKNSKIWEEIGKGRGEIKSFPSKLSFRVSHGWIEGEVFSPTPRNFFYPITVYALPICPVNFERNEFCAPGGKQGKMCRGKCDGEVWPERRIKEEEEEGEEVGGKVCEGIEGCALPRVNVNEKRKERRPPLVKPWRSLLPPVAVSTLPDVVDGKAR